MIDLAPVVYAMERLDSTSAAVLRRAAYLAMQEAGVDVAKLVHSAREEILADRKARAERSANSLERLQARAAAIPELSARVHGGPAAKVGELIEKELTDDEIQVALGVDRGYIRAVRNLRRARVASKKLTKERKAGPKKHWERVTQILSRPAWTSKPTNERKRHLGEGEEFTENKVNAEQKTHTHRWPCDQIRDMLTEQEYDAAVRLYDAWHDMQPGSKVGSLDGGGGGSDPATKLGVSPRQQKGGREWAALWPKLATGLKYTAQNLILGRPWAGDERALTFVELGRKAGKAAGPDQARGVAQGMLKATCAALAQISKDYDATVKAEKRQVFRSMLQHRDIMNYIAAGDGVTASSLMCKRTGFQAWLIFACVNKALKEAEAAREKAA